MSFQNDSQSSDNNLIFVSFSDDGDLSNLLSNEEEIHGFDNITEVPAYVGAVSAMESRPVDITETASSHNGTVPSSLPQRNVYGSLPNNSTTVGSPSRRVIYCIHGKPSGCCMVTEGEIIERNIDSSASDLRRSNDTSGEHCHRNRVVKVDEIARRKLIIASVLCVIFMIGEVIGGVLSNSLAIATDAAHLLTDFASFMISLFSLWVASRPPTRTMSFGWYRAEVIGALTSVLMIWVVTAILVYLAIMRLITKDFEINATVMLATSAVGVGVNLIMGLTLHQHGHSHGGGDHGHSHSEESGGHGHSHDVERNRSEQKQVNINVRAAFIHVIGDFIQSIGVFIAALVIYFKPEWVIVDPICTFLFSALVLATTFAILRDTLMVLMEGMPKGVDFADVMSTFMQIEGVVKVHNLRIWALSLNKTALSAHLAIRPGVVPQDVLRLASRNIHDRFNFFEMTLQIEEFDQNMEDCTQCKAPEN